MPKRFKTYADLYAQYERLVPRALKNHSLEQLTDSFNATMYRYASQNMNKFAQGMTHRMARLYARRRGLSYSVK